MSTKEYKWLPHLENSLTESVFGYTVTLYAIALEGWRRGLRLKFIKTNRSKSNTVFELSDGQKTHRFVSSRGDLVTREALRICKDKFETKKYLRKNNVPTPEGRKFSSKESDDKILDYAEKLGYPVVIKPVDGTGGRGVIAGIDNKDQFISSLKHVRYKLGFEQVIVEKHFKGDDYRVYVVDDKVVAATKRIPANIIGDGQSTIKQLIKNKNQEKRNSKLYRTSLIKIDKELKDMLKQQNYTLESIPASGEIVYLKSKNNISTGGDPVDILDKLSDDIKQIAIAALNAIPGLPHGGIDLLINHENNEAVVLEINSQASIRLNLFPLKGQARDVPKKIIDYYFPDTSSNPSIPLYFDFGMIWEEFKKGTSSEITIPNVPKGKTLLKRYEVIGRVQRVGFGAWIRRKARDLNIHGHVRLLKNGRVSIVACGGKEDIKKFEEILNNEAAKRFTIKDIEEKHRSTPVTVGFKIKNASRDRKIHDGYYPVRLKDPGSKSRKKVSKKTKRKSKTVKKIDYEKEYYKILNSTSWKITKPLRILGKLIKRN